MVLFFECLACVPHAYNLRKVFSVAVGLTSFIMFEQGLEATETIGEGEAVIEYTGEVMYKDQFNKDNFYKR